MEDGGGEVTARRRMGGDRTRGRAIQIETQGTGDRGGQGRGDDHLNPFITSSPHHLTPTSPLSSIAHVVMR